MDAGCALGGALRLFSEIYPLASLYGIDFSENAIKICEKEYGKFAVFSVGDLGDIEGFYDLITAQTPWNILATLRRNPDN